jgi:hypothetical protein
VGRQPVSKAGPCRRHEGSTPSPSANERKQSPGRRTGISTAFRPQVVWVRIPPGVPGGCGVQREHGSLPSSRYEFESRRPLHEGGDPIEELWRRWSARRIEEPEELVRFQWAPPGRGGAGVVCSAGFMSPIRGFDSHPRDQETGTCRGGSAAEQPVDNRQDAGSNPALGSTGCCSSGRKPGSRPGSGGSIPSHPTRRDLAQRQSTCFGNTEISVRIRGSRPRR